MAWDWPNEARYLAQVTPIVFVSRGRGRGHAVPDAMIANALRALSPATTVNFISYAMGAQTLREYGKAVIDIELCADPEVLPLMVRAASAIASCGPAREAVVVSHEEFAVLPVARTMAAKSVVFLTDWLPEAGSFQDHCLDYADEIVILDEEGGYEPPDRLAARVSHVGAVVHGMPTTVLPTEHLRASWGADLSSIVVLVAPGGTAGHSETATPLCRLIVDAWRNLPFENRRLLWLADEAEEERLLDIDGASECVTILRPHTDLVSTMSACDVVITKANRITTIEASLAGVPSLSISFGVNCIDDRRVAMIDTNVVLRAGELTPDVVVSHMTAAINRGKHAARRNTGAALLAAQRILQRAA